MPLVCCFYSHDLFFAVMVRYAHGVAMFLTLSLQDMRKTRADPPKRASPLHLDLIFEVFQ